MQVTNFAFTSRVTSGELTVAVGYRADQQRFLPLLITLQSSTSNTLLATRRVTQFDVVQGESVGALESSPSIAGGRGLCALHTAA